MTNASGIERTPLCKERSAAEYLGLSVRTLQRLRSAGGGPAFIRLGKRLIAYRQSELDRWANAQTYPHRAAELAQAAAAAA